ncbi:MAG TPA: hypothetical protein VE596_15890 [Gaiellaceae bacterium]|nr:hypothetical protein [Gaiellaceae bacterium]
MDLFGKQDAPGTWDGFEFGLTCAMCGHSWKHRIAEWDKQPAVGETINVTFSFACPNCGTGGTGKGALVNAGPPVLGNQN